MESDDNDVSVDNAAQKEPLVAFTAEYYPDGVTKIIYPDPITPAEIPDIGDNSQE